MREGVALEIRFVVGSRSGSGGFFSQTTARTSTFKVIFVLGCEFEFWVYIRPVGDEFVGSYLYLHRAHLLDRL